MGEVLNRIETERRRLNGLEKQRSRWEKNCREQKGKGKVELGFDQNGKGIVANRVT